MPDPISSSSVLPDYSPAARGDGDDPSLTCQAPTAPQPQPNSCEPAATVPEPLSSASSVLVQRFSNSDHRAFIAASTQPAPAAPAPSLAAPSGPPAFTVRPSQLDFQTGIPQFQSHGSLGDLQVTAKGDLLNAGAHIGVLNEDGSHGANAGAGVNFANGEVTVDYHGWSFSLGLGSSLGGSISSGGGRDLDGDGKPERCFKMTLGPLTLGECDEL